MNEEQYQQILERIDKIEFRQELLFYESEINRSLFEYGITRKQYEQIMDLMDQYRKRIWNKEECNSSEFEMDLYGILPDHDGNYHMCEEFAKAFYDDGRWQEVFIKLYGDNPKYAYVKGSE